MIPKERATRPVTESRAGIKNQLLYLATTSVMEGNVSSKYRTTLAWSAAKQGLLAWVVYWLADCLFATLLPRLTHQGELLVIAHVRVAVLLLGCYCVIGLIAGGVAGWLFGVFRPGAATAERSELPRLLGTFTVVAGHSTSIAAAADTNLIAWLGLSFPLLLVAGFVASIASEAWSRRLRLTLDPLIVCPALVGRHWILGDLLVEQNLVVRTTVSVLYFVMLLGLGYFLTNRGLRPESGHAPLRPRRQTLNLVCIALPILFGIGFFAWWDQSPHTEIAVPNSPVEDTKRPNVVLITMDTVRADRLSVYGNERDTTPNLREFSNVATLYRRAVAASDMTLPSHASIFTGLYPSWHGSYPDPGAGFAVGRALTVSAPTLAEMLAGEGYFTSAVTANRAFLGTEFALNRGFIHYQNPVRVLLRSEGIRPFFRNLVLSLLARVHPMDDFEVRYVRSERINREVFAVIERARELSQPFFLFVNYMDAHEPYAPPAPFDRLFPGKESDLGYADYTAMRTKVLMGERAISERERRHYLSQYDGGIAYEDAAIGDLLARLKEADLFDDSLIIVTADHGEGFGEKATVGHFADSVYQNQVHVPLLIKFPGVGRGEVNDELVSHVDLFPTVVEVAGLKPPKGLQGKSLLSRSVEVRPVLAEVFPGGELAGAAPRFYTNRRALFSGNWKLIASASGERELYDLDSDPLEERNLFGELPAVAGELDKTLAEMLLGAPKPGAQDAPDGRILDQLKSLGYIQ